MRRSILVAAFGLWVSGILVGANAVDLFPSDPSLPPAVMFGIGVIATIGNACSLYKRAGQGEAKHG